MDSNINLPTTKNLLAGLIVLALLFTGVAAFFASSRNNRVDPVTAEIQKQEYDAEQKKIIRAELRAIASTNSAMDFVVHLEDVEFYMGDDGFYHVRKKDTTPVPRF